MRLLLTGRNGQLGWELERRLAPLGELRATDRGTLDVSDPDALRAAIRAFRPDVIVNPAAYTAVDRAEQDPDAAMRVNAHAPGVMAEEAARLGAFLLHFSTDYVFSGEATAPYAEHALPAPLNAYGASKLAGERAVAASGCRHLILRAGWVYAPRAKNFFVAIANKALAGERLRVVDDQVGAPMSAAFLAAATAAALRLVARPARAPLRTLYHVSPDGHVSWCGFARAIVARLRPGTEVTPVSSIEYALPARRPAYSVLDNRLARAELGLPATPWESLLDDCVAAYRAAGGAAPA